MGHGLALSTRDQQVAWHDFGGFPPELYTLQYAAPGSPELAARAQALLADAGIAADRDPRRPLDHGARCRCATCIPRSTCRWCSCRWMERDAAGQLELGRAGALRDEDVLIIGSGSLTHNLRDVRMPQDAPPASYVPAFQQWYAGRLADHDLPALLDWQARAPGAAQAHPHDDHLMPLYVALGAAAGGHAAERRDFLWRPGDGCLCLRLTEAAGLPERVRGLRIKARRNP